MADVEANLLTKKGEKIPYFFNGYSGKFKNTECLIGMGIDISTRKKVENEVRIKEEKYRYLFNNNPAIILIWDIESLQLLEANDTALKEYGYTREEIPGMSMLDIRLEEDYERLRIFAKKMLAQTEPMARGIWRHKRRNGELIYMDISSHRISYNSRPAILTLAENITQKLLTEERLKKSYDDIRLLNQHLETIREEERAGIAREIHDELGQQLTALKMDVYWLNNKVSNNTPQTTERLASMISLIDETVKTVRRIASDLRPGILDDLGLIAALEWQSAEFEKRTGIKTIFTTQISDVELEKKMATGIFRVYQEVLTNVARHANATLVETNVELADGVFCLSVQDNGVGFDPDDVKSKNTLGLIGMQERVAMLNGELILESKLNDGVKAMIKVPLQKNT